jgi:hypothetical protein
MWEARSRAAVFDEFLAWVCEKGVPEIEAHPQHVSSEVFSSTDHRVVVISRWHRDPLDVPAPPAHLVARSAHDWDFTQVDR